MCIISGWVDVMLLYVVMCHWPDTHVTDPLATFLQYLGLQHGLDLSLQRGPGLVCRCWPLHADI